MQAVKGGTNGGALKLVRHRESGLLRVLKVVKKTEARLDAEVVAYTPSRLYEMSWQQPRPWIIGPDFGTSNLRVLFSVIFAHLGASGPQKYRLEVMTDLCAQNESSGAGLRPSFRSRPPEV